MPVVEPGWARRWAGGLIVFAGLFVQGGASAATDAFACTLRTTPEYRPFEQRLLRFVREWQHELCGAMGLPVPQARVPFEIELGLAQNTARAIDHAVIRGRSGYFGLVRIPDPAAIDTDALRFALTSAIVRTGVYNRSPGTNAVTEPPVWFVRGLARHADRRRRGADFEAAHARWSSAGLPGIAALWDRERSPAAVHPEVAAQLIAWCAARDDHRERWRVWQDYLAGGGRWEAAAMARIWGGSPDLTAWDAEWDLWVWARSRRVMDPGTTPAGVVRRFRSHLLLYPWDCAILPPCVELGGTPLAWFMSHPDRLEPASALAKARRIRLLGAGRDPVFQRMTAAYADALNQLAGGASSRELRAAWSQAEALRRDVEEAAAGGGTLRRNDGRPGGNPDASR